MEVEEEEEGEEGRETSDEFSTISGYDSLEAGLNISSTDCLLSFSNPNYSGPDLARVGLRPERGEVKRRRGGGGRDEVVKEDHHQLHQEDQHTNFAAALMSPPVEDLPHPALELRETGTMAVRCHFHDLHQNDQNMSDKQKNKTKYQTSK